MSLSKEQLLTINGLKLSGIVNEMDNNQLAEYCKALFTFTEKFPYQETELKNLINAKDYNAFCRVLSSVQNELEKIQATGLAHSCFKLLEEINAQKYNITQAHLAYLLAEVSELSIDIQVSWQKNKTANDAAGETDKNLAPAKPAGAYTEVVDQRSILAVDDVSLTLNSLKLALTDTKYKLTGVKSGADALKFIKNHAPDLFVLDIEMPEMDGYELAKEIRSRGQTAPIIFLTGNAKQEYVIKAIKAGAVDFIVKPVNKENVLEKIKKYIG